MHCLFFLSILAFYSCTKLHTTVVMFSIKISPAVSGFRHNLVEMQLSRKVLLVLPVGYQAEILQRNSSGKTEPLSKTVNNLQHCKEMENQQRRRRVSIFVHVGGFAEISNLWAQPFYRDHGWLHFTLDLLEINIQVGNVWSWTFHLLNSTFHHKISTL